MHNIKECRICCNYSDNDVCDFCQNEKRIETGQLCIVESPSDVEAVEQSNTFFGRYFVLHGHLSPIDGIGHKELRLDKLEELFKGGSVSEVILATNPTVEGDTTANYIADMALAYGIEKISKLASGMPLGGDITAVDKRTLASSITHRRPI